MKISFDIACRITLNEEGGYTNNPKDSGNWTGGKIGKGKLKGTKFGISAAAYPKLDIENLTADDAKAIYLKDYWNKIKAEELPEQLRISVFDLAINSGPSAAIKVLQKAAKVAQDGQIGPTTIREAKYVGLHSYTEARIAHYEDIVERNPEKAIFLKGWTKRAKQIEEITKAFISTVT